MRKLWLADHLLVSERGHHVSYNGFIADSARRAGMEVRILCARDCSAHVPGGFAMRGIFRRDLRNNPSRLISRSRIALDALETLARRRFESDLLTGITPDEVQRHDIIFAEMLAPRNLAGWLRWLQAFPKGREPTLVLHVGYASERFGADKEIPVLLGLLERSSKLSRAHFATDSDILKEKYKAIFRRPVTHLPLVISRRASECYRPPGNPPHFVCLGNARQEKGFAEILAAIDILNSDGGLLTLGSHFRAATPTNTRQPPWPASAPPRQNAYRWSLVRWMTMDICDCSGILTFSCCLTTWKGTATEQAACSARR